MVNVLDLMKIVDLCKENSVVTADKKGVHIRTSEFKEFEDSCEDTKFAFSFRVLNDKDCEMPLMYREVNFFGVHIYTILFESELMDIYGLTWEEAKNNEA